MKTLLRILSISIFVFSFASPVIAAQVSVRPFLIDETVEPRDVVTKDITLTSAAPHRINIYATVNEITVDNEGEIKDFVSPVMTDRTNTITSWVEISRARTQLDPGESADVPLTLKISPKAEPGEYHVFIGFVPAANRPAAQAVAMNGDADGVIVKITVDDTTSESLRINEFSIKRFIFKEDHLPVTIELENIGDAPSNPTGEIIFYDHRGEEIGAAKVNESGEVIGPETILTLSNEVPFFDKLGRFKANITLNYGDDNKAVVFDTTQFYMIPQKILIILLLCIVGFSILVTLLLKKAFGRDDYEDDDTEGTHLPLFVQTGREYKETDHDITLKKHE